MKLNKLGKKICKRYAPTGYMGEGCYECPLMVDRKKSKCMRSADKENWTRQDWLTTRKRIENWEEEHPKEKENNGRD